MKEYLRKEFVMKRNLLKKVLIYVLPAAMAVSAFTACDKDENEPIVQHDTTYSWKTDESSAFYPIDGSMAKKSADSVQVRYVIIKATGDFSNKSPLNWTANRVNGFEPAIKACNDKLRGTGNLNIGKDGILDVDKKFFEALGFTIELQH
jgi:hypothetical protein